MSPGGEWLGLLFWGFQVSENLLEASSLGGRLHISHPEPFGADATALPKPAQSSNPLS
jgi:hypothetical protein